MSDTTRGIYIVRHGSTRLNGMSGGSEDRIRGHLDVPLDSRGKQEAEEAAQSLVGKPIYRVEASDLKRAADTGRTIANKLKVPFETDRAFRPWNLGGWQGKPSKDVQPQLEQYVTQKPNVHVPGGESFTDFVERFLPAFSKLIEEVRNHKGDKNDLVLCSHFRCLKLTMAWLANGAPKSYEVKNSVLFQNNVSPGDVYYLDLSTKDLPKELTVVNG